MYFKNGLNSIPNSWDCCLIEIKPVPKNIIPASIAVSRSDRLLSVSVQNFARIGSADHFLKGEVVVVENEFAFIPMFTPSGASGCGLFTRGGRLVGIVQSTYDTADGIEIEKDVYSARQIGTLFVKALTNARHEAVLSRVLVCAQILAMYSNNPAMIENISDNSETTALLQLQESRNSPPHTLSDSGGSFPLGKRNRSNSTPDSHTVKREKTAKVIRNGEVIEVIRF